MEETQDQAAAPPASPGEYDGHRRPVRGKRDDALGAIEAACRKEAPFYGSYFDIAFDRQDADTFEMRAERCFFRDYFARHDNMLLTTVVCAWDANWMRAVDPAVSGLRAERTSLLSLGDDACRFRVVRTGDPLAPYTDKLDQRFGGGQATG
jgi:L-2-amino-thiazoline-4-carboxylic acid hydrolase